MAAASQDFKFQMARVWLLNATPMAVKTSPTDWIRVLSLSLSFCKAKQSPQLKGRAYIIRGKDYNPILKVSRSPLYTTAQYTL